jgi:hypothetical protein
MARTLVNAHQLAPFSGSTAVQVKVDSSLYNGPGSGDAKDASLNLLSGSLTEMGTLYFTNGTTGVGGSIAYESSAFQFYGASRFQGNLEVVGTLTGDTSLTLDGTTFTTAELGVLDGVTPGTAAASKAMVLDASADISGARHITLSGELDAGSGDFSGNIDVDGIANLDAVDIDGTVQIDGVTTFGVDDTGVDVKMFGATASRYLLWDESRDALAATDNVKLEIGNGQDMEIYHDGTDSFLQNKTGIMNIANGTSGIAINIGHGTSEVTIGDNLTVAGNLTVTGTTTTVDVEVIQSANGVIFEGATADGNETTLKAVDPTADHTVQIANASGFLIPFAAVSTTTISATPAEINVLDDMTATTTELNLLDGGTSVGSSITIADGDGIIINDGGTMKTVPMSDVKTYAGAALNIDGFDALGSAAVHQTQDHFVFSDNGTEKKITFSNLQDAVFADVSGDATIAAGGALTIAAQAVENSMLADDAVGADELASNAVVNASVVDGAIKADKLDIDGSTDIGAALADADLFIVDDGAGGTNRKAAMSRVKVYTKTDVSSPGAGEASKALIMNASSEIASGVSSFLGTDLIGATSIQSRGTLGVTGSVTLGVAGSDPTAVITANAPFSASYGIAVFGEEGADGIISLAADQADDAADRWNLVAMASSGRFEIRSGGGGNSPFVALSSGDCTVLGDLTISGDDLKMATNTSGYMLVADGTSYNPVAISGDVTMANNGAVTIAAGAVEHGMLADDIISGQAETAHADIADADELMLSDNGTITRVGVDSLRDHFFGVVSGDATIADGGALTIAATAVEASMLNNNIISGTNDIGANLQTTDEILVSDGGTLKRCDLSRLALLQAGDGLQEDSGQMKVAFTIDSVRGSSGHNYNGTTGVYTCSDNAVSGSEMVFLNGQMLMPAAALANGDYTIATGSVELHPDLKLDGDDVLRVYYLE